MIIDAFIFYNEVDLLEIRLEELDPVVELFVLVQADKTFRGDDKPFYFDAADPRWAKWRDKIIDCRVSIPDLPGPWEREKYQRNIISEELKAQTYYNPEAVVLISDVDEIPRREAVGDLDDELELRFPVAFAMKHYNYGLNCRFPGVWAAAKALRADDLTTAEEIRQATFPPIEDGGWHFSYFGDDEFISKKFKSFSHSEVDTPLVHSRIAENRRLMLDPHNHGRQLTVEAMDDPSQWPHAVQDNPKYWSRYVW